MLTGIEAKELMAAGKPSAKGKTRRAEIEADTELEGRLTDAQTKNRRPKDSNTHDPKMVKAGALRGVASETMARVYEELWPTMTTHDSKGNVDLEIAEETYILVLTMIVGTDEDKPRLPLKIREVEMNVQFCEAHS